MSVETYQRVLAWCDRSSLQGQRDYALLRLLWANALRRIEVTRLNVSDFDPEERKLRILGKGRGRQTELVDLDAATTEAIADWLSARGYSQPDAPLFTALDFANSGHRLTGDAIRKIVVRYCEKAGIKKIMSPHRIRHSAITAALDATDGNLRKVQKLSRHKNIETVTVYDDNRKKDQREITDLLGGMI